MRVRGAAQQHAADADDSGDDGHDELDDKLAVRRAKNREAARRVRERRMNQIKTLSEQVAALTLENERLKQLNDAKDVQQHNNQASPAGGQSELSATQGGTPTHSNSKQQRSMDKGDRKSLRQDLGDCATTSDGSRTSDGARTSETGVQTDVTMAAADWSPSDVMQVMTLLTRSSLQQAAAADSSGQRLEVPLEPTAQQLQQLKLQVDQVDQLPTQPQQQLQPQTLQLQQQQQQPKPQRLAAQQQLLSPAQPQPADAISPSNSQATAASTLPQMHDEGAQTQSLPSAATPFTLEQVQALLDAHSKLLAAQQPSPAAAPAPGISPTSATSAMLPLPLQQQLAAQQQQQLAVQQQQLAAQQQQFLQEQQRLQPLLHNQQQAQQLQQPHGKRSTAVAPSRLSPEPAAASRRQAVPTKQEAPPVQARQPTWQDLRMLRAADAGSIPVMAPWSQQATGPTGPAAVAAAQAAASLATSGRPGSLTGRSGEAAAFAPLLQMQHMYSNQLPGELRQRSAAGLLFSLDDADVALMSTDGNLLSDMNLGLTSDMNLASEELLRHVPLPEDAAALGHTAWL